MDTHCQKNSGNIDYEWAVGLNRAGLTVFGVWPEDGKAEQKNLMSFLRLIIISNITIWSCAIPSLHYLLKIWGDILSMIDNLQCTLPVLMGIMKLFIMWQKKKNLLPLLNMIKDDWSKVKTEKERDVMMKNARIVRTLTMFGYFIMFFSVILVLTLPIIGISIGGMQNITQSDKLMPLQSYYIYDANKSPFYEMTFIAQSLSLVSIAFIYTSTDNFLGLLVFHICAQFKNLRERLLHLNCYNFNSILSNSVQDHRRLIRSIKIIDNTFNMMFLGMMFYFCLLFALQGFLFITMMTQGRDISLGRFIFIILAFFAVFTHIFLYCILGEILVIQCDGFYETICEYEWYKLEPRRARNLLLIMIRSNKPLHLTAGKLFPMTMSTLCSLLKTSGGYISFLLAYRE